MNEKVSKNRTRKKKLFFVISYYKPQEKNFLENFGNGFKTLSRRGRVVPFY